MSKHCLSYDSDNESNIFQEQNVEAERGGYHFSLHDALNSSYCDPSYAALVPDLWLSGPAPNPLLRIIVAATFLVLCFVNNVCSVLLFIVFWR